MKLDTFSKVLLVLIALFLGIIALSPYIGGRSAYADPGAKFDYVQVWGNLPGHGLLLFDTRDGSLWEYWPNALEGKTKPEYAGKLTELGEPIAKN